MLIYLLVIFLGLGAKTSSYPYISGDTFRAACDFVYDDITAPVDFKKSRWGSTFFVKIDELPSFFRLIHPKLKFPYVLVTHNADLSAPGFNSSRLDDPMILAWYGQNPDRVHPKLHPIPIGLANRCCWAHGDIDIFNRVLRAPMEKSRLLYLNFNLNNYLSERQQVYDLFKDAPFCYIQSEKPYEEYLYDMGASKFVLSPRGLGLDCHRTWEALLLGSIPIVKASPMDAIFEDLPVLIVNDWAEVTEELLNKKWAEHLLIHYNTEKLYFDYWLKQINQFKR